MARPVKRCNCRDADGRKLGQSCLKLAKRDHGDWWVRYEAPAGPDGKRRRPWAGPYDTKTAAEKALPTLQSQAGSGRPIPVRKIKLGSYLDTWLAGKRTLAERTRRSYDEHIRLYLKPGLGHLPLGELREEHLDELYQAIALINRPAGGQSSEMLHRLIAARALATWGDDPAALHNTKPISPTRIRRVHATLSSALTTAYRQKKIGHDPSKNVELPTAKRRRPLLWTAERVARWTETGRRPGPVMVWTPAQCGQFLDFLVARDDRLYALYHLVATRGLRRSEACGLRWADTDLDGARSISIMEDEGEQEAAGEEHRLKTDSSRRVVALDDANIKLLKVWRKNQREERLAAGGKWTDSGLVFTDELGAAVDVDYLTKRFARLVRTSTLPPTRLHDLRHCAATLMLAAGIDMKVVSATLGHSQYWFTADTYTSVVPELAAAAAEAAVAMIPRRSVAHENA
ncbi:MAG: phage integrase [Sphaerisporangium sp.]|nr:phage integrase [Sphaerisporangium sp.]